VGWEPNKTTHNRKKNTMKKTLTTYEIANALDEDQFGGWTRPGAFALAEYLEDLEQDLGEEFELDVVAIRCDFNEYTSLEEWAELYFYSSTSSYEDSLGLTENSTEEDRNDCIREYILDHGQLVEFSGGVIVSSF
jgi:hypothetical protein